MVHHGHGRGSRNRVRRAEHPSQRRLHAEEVEAVWRHPGNREALRQAVADVATEIVQPHAHDTLTGPRALPIATP